MQFRTLGKYYPPQAFNQNNTETKYIKMSFLSDNKHYIIAFTCTNPGKYVIFKHLSFR